MKESDVLIIGAGPTGLVLALSLARRGVIARIIDKKKGTTDTSRAIVVHARTLELYTQLGLANDVRAHGMEVKKIHVLQPGGGDHAIDLAGIGEGQSPFPNILCYPQDTHERLLVDKLREAGVEIEWETTFNDLKPGDGHVEVTLAKPDGATEVTHATYVCGCDGGHSRVREICAIDFQGGDYEKAYFVIDAKIDGVDPADARVSFDSDVLALMFPVRPGQARLIGVVPSRFPDPMHVELDAFREEVEALLRLKIAHVNWFSTFRVHHRVAEHFRRGRCFLSGDAGHVHSPVGGQGMNTGIGDAFDLSWRLAEILHGRAAPSLLDSYEGERLAFAKQLVTSTDAVFGVVNGHGLASRFARSAVPRIAPRVMRLEAVRKMGFATVSQTKIEYRNSPLSEGRAGTVFGGDRLPWTGSNYDCLKSNRWQLHVYGDVPPLTQSAAAALGLPVEHFTWSDKTDAAGFRKSAGYLVRPDGYVGLAFLESEASKLSAYADRHELRFTAEEKS